MHTEPPGHRLRRRLDAGSHAGGDTGRGTGTDAASDLGHDDRDTADSGEPDTSLSRWLPTTSAEGGPGWLAAIRADPGRAGTFALGAVAVLAVMFTVVTLMSDDGPPVASAKLSPVQMSSPTAGPSATAANTGPVVVSVVGLVRTPGLVTLPVGARIADAVAAAGGVLSGADVVGLNMAQRLADGQQIIVGVAPMPNQPPALGSGVTPPSGSVTPGAQAPGDSPSGPVDLNTATVEQLDTLPGVGPVTAKAIVAWRESNGGFTSVDQLAEVDGIGPARLEKLRALVRV